MLEKSSGWSWRCLLDDKVWETIQMWKPIHLRDILHSIIYNRGYYTTSPTWALLCELGYGHFTEHRTAKTTGFTIKLEMQILWAEPVFSSKRKEAEPIALIGLKKKKGKQSKRPRCKLQVGIHRWSSFFLRLLCVSQLFLYKHLLLFVRKEKQTLF